MNKKFVVLLCVGALLNGQAQAYTLFYGAGEFSGGFATELTSSSFNNVYEGKQ